MYSGGLTYGNQVQCEIDWWIFWGRVAGGLNRNQQTDVYQRLSGFLLPRGSKKPQRINASLLREMWRAAASLELLPLGTKTELGEALVKRVKAGDFKESELWCLSRLGARKLFYGPINLVVPPADGGALGRGAAEHAAAPATRWPLARRTGGPHARPARRHPRDRQAQAAGAAARPSACWPCSKAKRKTSARWAGSSARNCLRGWCWRRSLRMTPQAVPFRARGNHRREAFQHPLQIGFQYRLGQHVAPIALEIGGQFGVVAVGEEDEPAHPRVQSLGQFHPVQTGRVDRTEGRVEVHALGQFRPGVGVGDRHHAVSADGKQPQELFLGVLLGFDH